MNKPCQNKECDAFYEGANKGSNCRDLKKDGLIICKNWNLSQTQKLDVNFRPDRENPVIVEVSNDNKQWFERILLFINSNGASSCKCVNPNYGQYYLEGRQFETVDFNYFREITEKKTLIMTDSELFKAGAIAFRSKNHKNSINSLLWVNDDLCIILDQNHIMGITPMHDSLKKASEWTANRKKWNSFEVEA